MGTGQREYINILDIIGSFLVLEVVLIEYKLWEAVEIGLVVV